MLQLFQGNCSVEFLRDHLSEWLRALSLRALSQRLPVIVVTPSVAKSHGLKSGLLRLGIPLLGVEFWGVEDLRRHFSTATGAHAPVADVALLSAALRSVAQEVSQADAGNAAAKALSRSAEALADTLFILESAGWGCGDITSEPLRSIAEKFGAEAVAAGQTTCGVFDFDILRRVRVGKIERQFATVLLWGFDALHWDAWPILGATVLSSEDAVVTLPVALEVGGDAEHLWCSSWEQLAGVPLEIFGDGTARNAKIEPLVRQLELRTRESVCDSADIPVRFVASATLTEEARGVALRAAKLITEGVESVGILVPGPGVLSREISIALDRLNLGHYTTLPGRASPVPHAGSWPALLDAIAAETVEALCSFLRTNGEVPGLFVGERGSSAVASDFERYAKERLVSEICVIRAVTGAEAEETRGQSVRQFLREWPEIPASASLDDFLKQIEALLRKLEWDELALTVVEARQRFAGSLQLRLSREALCDWLRKSLPNRRVRRSEFNGNPYASIHVLTPSDAVDREWGHIILCGQNEGAWPPPLKPAGYLGEEAVRALNAQARQLNRQATRQGVYGEGMNVIADGKGFCLGPIDQRLLYFRDLIRLLESAEHGVTFSAALLDETEPGRVLQPGDFYRKAFVAMTGEQLDAEGLRRIALGDVAPVSCARINAAEVNEVPIQHAWKQRNNAQALTEFEFTLGAPCDFPVVIPPSRWGVALSSPAEVFLESYLGVRAPSDLSQLADRTARGIWTHRFVEAGAKNAVPGDEAQWIATTAAAADKFEAGMTMALSQCGRSLPVWWRSVLVQSKAKAISISEDLGRTSAGKIVVCEKRIPTQPVRLKSGKTLTVSGRFDLLLAERVIDAERLAFNGSNLRLIDIKTGADKALKGAKSLTRFEGLQLALYLLALKERGAGEVDAGFVKHDIPWSAQLTNADVQSQEAQDVFDRMADMQEMGAFGWTGMVRDPFSFGCNYPIATLAPVTSPTRKFFAAHGC